MVYHIVPQDPKSDILHHCCHNDTIATTRLLVSGVSVYSNQGTLVEDRLPNVVIVTLVLWVMEHCPSLVLLSKQLDADLEKQGEPSDSTKTTLNTD